MPSPSLTYLLRGPFSFLRSDLDEIRELVPDYAEILPLPQRVFLEDESATPLWGFPILISNPYVQLRTALQDYLVQEELMQAAVVRRSSVDRMAYNRAWEVYRGLLSRALENVTLSSYGRHYPGIFWLHHSLDVARCLKETPRRILRMDTQLAREHGDGLKYRVFDRFQDRILSTTYDMVNRLAVDTEEMEEELFPRLLRRMLDNVLIFTEHFLGQSLEELGSYFQGYLRIDGRDLRRRLANLESWHEDLLKTDFELRSVVRDLLGKEPDEPDRGLLQDVRYLKLLTSRPDYDPQDLLPPDMHQVWEKLLVKLKEFELFHALRRFAIPMKRKDDGRLFCRPSNLSRTWVGSQELFLSGATRPLDFMEAWVVDPVVDRNGMIYDIADFSGVISLHRLSTTDTQDQAFRMMFRFQRRINRLAQSYRIKLEKYLGDGAFYSSRHPRELLLCAIHLQRYYTQALAEGFPFDHGLRIALNHGSYRLIPLRSTSFDDADRYEFFGHGLVELSRLTSGKAARDVDEIKNLLISQGYNETTVHRFFAPLMQGNVDLVDKLQESQRFYAYINPNGHLINEGIVATEKFIAELERQVDVGRLFRVQRAGASYVVIRLRDGAETDFRVALRKLGVVRLKGLDPLTVFEVVDGADLTAASLQELPEGRLLATLEREFTHMRHL